MRLISPVTMFFALIAGLLCLLYGSVPKITNGAVYYIAPRSGMYAGYGLKLGCTMIASQGGGAILRIPAGRSQRFAGLKRFLEYIKLAHKGEFPI